MFVVCTDATPYFPDPVPLAPAVPAQPVQRGIVQPGMIGSYVAVDGCLKVQMISRTTSRSMCVSSLSSKISHKPLCWLFVRHM